MELALKVFDKTVGGKRHFARELRLVSTQLTVRELIARRIEEEAAEQQAEDGNSGRGQSSTVSFLVVPSFVETILNGRRNYGLARIQKHPVIDRMAQLEAATAGFQRNQFLMFVDDRQVADLDESITLKENSTVTFIKIVPLVGG